MTPELVSLIVGVIGGLTGLGAFVSALYNRRRIYAEAEKTEVDSAQVLALASVALLEPMQLQIARLSAHLIEAHAKVDVFDDKLKVCNEQLNDARVQVRLLTKNVDDLTAQLGRYQDRFGPL